MLHQAGLLNTAIDGESFSILHVLPQTAVQLLSEDDRTRYQHVVIQLLTWGFPDRWTQDQTCQAASWPLCQRCLSHVLRLVEISAEYNIKVSNQTLYGELMLRTAWWVRLHLRC